MSFWANRVLPHLIEKACRSTTILEERKRWVPHAHGNVLELGVGSGLNLPFYDAAKVTRVTGIDPSAPLLEKAATRASSAPVAVELLQGHAESLPFADRSFDTVLVTYSLCSVEDPLRALVEARRVLRPDGELVFVEHGLALDPKTQKRQRMLTPLWRRVSGNCHLDRDIGSLLGDAGLRSEGNPAAPPDGPEFPGFPYQGTARTS